MTSVQAEIFNRNVQLPVVNDGYRPQLYLAASGSYAGNAVYGSGAASTGNYDTVTLRGDSSSLNQTGAALRKEDTDIYFTTVLTLDSTQDDPHAQSSDELRIRVQQPLNAAAGEPGSYLNQLPLPDPLYPLPLFECDIINVTTGQPLLPSQADHLLKARMLIGGDLALLRRSTAGPPVDTALLASDLASLFGQSVAANIRINVRGTYRKVH
jgi:hypothetical protein